MMGNMQPNLVGWSHLRDLSRVFRIDSKTLRLLPATLSLKKPCIFEEAFNNSLLVHDPPPSLPHRYGNTKYFLSAFANWTAVTVMFMSTIMPRNGKNNVNFVKVVGSYISAARFFKIDRLTCYVDHSQMRVASVSKDYSSLHYMN